MNMINVKLGKLPAKSTRSALLFADYLKTDTPPPPKYNYWAKRAKFPDRSFGNTNVGDCTFASQAVAAMRMERIETRSTPKITDDSVLKAYYDLTQRLYGGGDTGAYETDALDNMRRADQTFRDVKGRPITIEAYTRINQYDQNEIKRALSINAGHVVKLCFNLPLAFERMLQSKVLDVPKGQALTGEWEPGSAGGHSTTEDAYNERGILHPTTWELGTILITWDFVAAYCDEAHAIFDQIDSWRKVASAVASINLNKLKSDVNNVSRVKI